VRRLLLGTWTLPSGNSLDAVLLVLAGDVPAYDLRCEWDRWPLSEREIEDYREHVAPEVYEACAVALGKKTLVIQI
jgi:hypothetical protein